METSRIPGGTKGSLIFGAAVFVMGLFPLLDLFGLLGRESGWNVPSWLAFIFSLIFPSLGLFLFFTGLSEKWKSAEPKLKMLGGLMLAVGMICFLGGGAIFLTWQAIAPSLDSSGYVAIGGIPIPLPPKIQNVIGRFFIGFVALLLDGIFLFAIWEGVRHLLSLRRKQVAP